jgi:CheY-like chemotaxis protein
VATAGDGRKGLALFEAGDFDLLFLDIFMPGIDGFETMRMVQHLRPLVPIIVISGRPIASDEDSAPDFLTMAIKLGAVSSLQKPFKPAALLAAVAAAMEAAKRLSSSSSHAAGGVASRP